MEPHIESFPARRHEMGRDRLMRIQSLCNCMEEAAGGHADKLGVGVEHLAENGLTWVLAKLRLDIRRRPGAGETVIIETWPVNVERIQFRRDFIIRDHNRDTLATAVTQWVVMGLDSRRVDRFPAHIAALVPDNPPLAQESGDIRIPAVADPKPGPCFPVRLADIDQNQHVNNVRYIDFILENALMAGKADEPRQLELIFRAESRRGDIIACASSPDEHDPKALIHSLTRQSDGQELVRARTVHSG